MLNQQGLSTLLDIEPGVNAPGVIVYCRQKTERLTYTCEFIFKHVLRVNYSITDQVNAFEASTAFKINYSEKELPGAFQILPHSLLSETGISELKPETVFKNELIYFYENKANSGFHFDVFSAVFYFISRYEEWQSFEPDMHGRFEARASILFQNNFHLKPVVDYWILELRSALEKAYPTLRFPDKKFKIISTIDVDNLYAYKSKGLIRTMGASFKDVIKFDFKNLKERLLVLLGKKEDPFDIYESVSEFCLNKQIPLVYFFLFKTGTKYDRTVDPKSAAFKTVFSVLKNNWAMVGIHPSYDASVKEELLKTEITDLSTQCGKAILFSRQHFLRFNIKSTPGLLIQNGIKADFSMGFASLPGFRAGTSHPFFYFDFKSEKKSELLFVPFCSMDGVYTVYENLSPEKALQSLMDLAIEIRKVNGVFISVFHERTFSDHLYNGFGTLYKNLHLKLKEL